MSNILIMSRIFSGILSGIFLGVYFAEKQLPFPLKYNTRPDTIGSLELDLSVFSTIADDIREAVGKPKQSQSQSPSSDKR
jgi:hypothetical protein